MKRLKAIFVWIAKATQCAWGHEMHWELKDGEPLILDGPIPDHAVCRKCGKTWAEINKKTR